MHLHTLKIAKRKHCKNADEGVVLEAIQIAVDSDQVLNARHPRDLHTFSLVTSLELLIQLRPRESSDSTMGW